MQTHKYTYTHTHAHTHKHVGNTVGSFYQQYSKYQDKTLKEMTSACFYVSLIQNVLDSQENSHVMKDWNRSKPTYEKLLIPTGINQTIDQCHRVETFHYPLKALLRVIIKPHIDFETCISCNLNLIKNKQKSLWFIAHLSC